MNAPSPALQPAIASTSRRSARKTVWTAARVPVSTRSPPSPLPLPVPLSVVVVTFVFFQWGKFWTAVAVWRCLSVPACTWGDVSLQDRPLLKTATHGEKAEIY